MTDNTAIVNQEPATYISAGDLEKYSYCPLSWWLSQEFEGESHTLRQGVKGHEVLGKSLWKIDANEQKARESETLVFWWAIVATLAAVAALEVLPIKGAVTFSQVLGVIALIWMLAATFFLFRATRPNMDSKVLEYERIILIFAIIAVLIALNAVAFSITDVRLAEALVAVALAWLMGACYFLYHTLKTTGVIEALRREFRIKGKIEYIDVDDSKLFKSEKYGLTGRPDYVIKVNENLIPVEEKTGRTPRGPLFSHILQVAAYCLLIEETSGKAPPYGIIKYPEHEHEIEYNEDLKKVLLEKLGEMRAIKETGDAHRNHERPGKCKNCSRREVCPERLA